jgi:prevent-host-death family protein
LYAYTCGMEYGHASMREARARLADLLDDAERGNVTLITRHGRTAAAIVPAELLEQLSQPGPALAAAADALRGALHTLEPLLPAKPARRAPYQARPGRAALVASSLAELRGPVHGVVELPLRLFWSAPDRSFDLDRPSMLRALYEIVLQEASRPEDLTSYLNGNILPGVWPELFLPKGVRRAWEDQHPALRAARPSAA